MVAVLEARGLPLTEGQRGVIEGTIDQGVLDGWLCRVSAVASAEELLGGVPG